MCLGLQFIEIEMRSMALRLLCGGILSLWIVFAHLTYILNSRITGMKGMICIYSLTEMIHQTEMIISRCLQKIVHYRYLSRTLYFLISLWWSLS